MAYKILSTHRIPLEGMNLSQREFEITAPEKKHFSREELLERIADYDVLIPVFGFSIDRELIERGKKLQLIANFGVGYNNIDVEQATRQGIMVTNTPAMVIEPTAELAFSLLLALSRRVCELNHKLKNREPVQWEVMANLGHTLQDKTVGIIGMGNIGKDFALKARAFGMHILYYTRTPLDLTDEKTYGARRATLEELLSQSDVISLHTPLTEKTHHMLNEEAFRMMKPGAFIINTARGAVIEEKALVAALQNGQLGGAGLDVFEFEPQITQELLGMDNVVLTPHIGTANYETRKAMAGETAVNISEYFKGNTPPNLINPEVKNNS